jgi:Uma2 family endonuclease
MAATLERISHPKRTEVEYLELERQSEVRHEFIDGRMLELPGPSKTHARIVTNMTVALAPPAHRKECRFVATDG